MDFVENWRDIIPRWKWSTFEHHSSWEEVSQLTSSSRDHDDPKLLTVAISTLTTRQSTLAIKCGTTNQHVLQSINFKGQPSSTHPSPSKTALEATFLKHSLSSRKNMQPDNFDILTLPHQDHKFAWAFHPTQHPNVFTPRSLNWNRSIVDVPNLEWWRTYPEQDDHLPMSNTPSSYRGGAP